MRTHFHPQVSAWRRSLQLLAWFAICVTLGQASAWAQARWLLDNTQVTAVKSYKEFDRGTPFDHNAPPGKDLVEVRGTLAIEEGSVFGPFKMSDIAISSVDERGRLWRETAVAVGSETPTKLCTYMSTRLPMGSSMHVDLEGGGALQLDRDEADAPPLFMTNARQLRLCLIFETEGTVPEKLVLEVPGRIVPINNNALTPDNEAVRKAVQDHPAHRAENLKFWLVTGVMGVTVILGILLLARGMLTERSNIMPEEATLKIYEKRESPQLYALAAGHEMSFAPIPRSGDIHVRKTFSNIGSDGGPGADDFHLALASLHQQDCAHADTLFAQALEKGLTDSYESGAWSFRGQAAYARGDVARAAEYFLRALESPKLTLEAARCAASHLAVLYRVMGMSADEKRMRIVETASTPPGVKADNVRTEAIARIARDYKAASGNAKRGRWKSWFHWKHA
ncbi:MAG: hypothetical protein KF778_22340 [Rhodocyclaceae bacterium]|nr:hypothetical protein [Rhodocyclaceae bacterium]MBX3671146.1 hypothetical protein [Rhodocyclaceae bacterium]